MEKQRSQHLLLLLLFILVILGSSFFPLPAEGNLLLNSPVEKGLSADDFLTGEIASDAFNDIKGHWAEKVIKDWQARQLVAGYPDGSFRPDNPITRAEFIAIVNRVFGYQEARALFFNDVGSSDWFAGEIAKAAAVGYIGGYPDGSVKPNNPITRQEVAAVFAKILSSSGKNDNDEEEYIQVKFLDNIQFPTWSRSAIMTAAACGYMSGYPDGTFKPVRYITRAEAISALDRAMLIKEALDEGQNLTGDSIHVSKRKNRDASLRSLAVNGEPLAGFAPDILTYKVTLPYGTTELPVVTAKASHSKARVTITQAKTLPGSASVVVKAESGRAQTYEVNFELALSTSKSITGFSFATPVATGVIDEETKTITVTVPYGTDVTNLSPLIMHTGASIAPASSTPQDFTDPVVYTVTAADGTTAQYTVTVTVVLSSIATVTSDVYTISTDGANRTISDVPYNTSKTEFLENISADDPNQMWNTTGLSDPIRDGDTLVVTAQDGTTTITYTVDVIDAGTDATLSGLWVDGTPVPGFDPEITTYNIQLPFGTTEVPTVTATVRDTGKATLTITQAAGLTAPNNVATVLVTAEDGVTKRTYTVTFMEALNPAKSITSFSFASPAVTGVINETEKTIAVTVPFGTDVANLTPTTVHTGASIEPASGTPQDFTNPVVYTVTAEDGTTAQYTVTVTIAPNTDASLTSLSVSPGSIDFDSETLTYDNIVVPYGTTEVTVSFTAAPQATTSVPSPQTVNIVDRYGTFTVEVTAGDGVTKKTYTINFVEALNPAKEITSFSFATPAVNGVIDEQEKTILVVVPFGTDVTNLTPTIVHTGASITPASGTPQDFTNPVVYTVTAEDGTTAQYMVTVIEASNTDASLFALAVNPGSIDFDSETLTYDNIVVPYGTTEVTVSFTAAPQGHHQCAFAADGKYRW
jgi:hypothetical protein